MGRFSAIASLSHFPISPICLIRPMFGPFLPDLISSLKTKFSELYRSGLLR
jgi:hypothetical protein